MPKQACNALRTALVTGNCGRSTYGSGLLRLVLISIKGVIFEARLVTIICFFFACLGCPKHLWVQFVGLAHLRIQDRQSGTIGLVLCDKFWHLLQEFWILATVYCLYVHLPHCVCILDLDGSVIILLPSMFLRIAFLCLVSRVRLIFLFFILILIIFFIFFFLLLGR